MSEDKEKETEKVEEEYDKYKTQNPTLLKRVRELEDELKVKRKELRWLYNMVEQMRKPLLEMEKIIDRCDDKKK